MLTVNYCSIIQCRKRVLLVIYFLKPELNLLSSLEQLNVLKDHINRKGFKIYCQLNVTSNPVLTMNDELKLGS